MEAMDRKKETGELKRVQPHKPHCEEVFIRGYGRRIADKDMRKFSNFHPTELFDAPLRDLACKQNVIALDVDNFALSPDDAASSKKLIVSYNYDICLNKVSRKVVKLVNKGTITIRYQLQQVRTKRIFDYIIPEAKPTVSFHFNKNEDIILPGQTVNFPIWFKTKTHGKHTETWKLVTRPSVIPEGATFLIVMEAYSEFGDILERAALIDNMLNARVAENIERRKREMQTKGTETLPPDPTFPKARVFEAINSNFNPMDRKPKYIYNHEAVQALEEFYQKIKKPDDPDAWNLHINLLLRMVKEREIEEYYEKHEGKTHMEYQYPIPVIEARSSSKTKQGKGKGGASSKTALKTKQAKDKSEGSSTSQSQSQSVPKPLRMELEELLQKCSEPFVRPNPKQKKYQLAYKIMCVRFDKMVDSIELMKENLRVNGRNPHFLVTNLKSINKCSPRLQNNILDDFENCKPMYDRSDLLAESAVPTDCLQNIPKDHVEDRFKLYRQVVLGIAPPEEVVAGGKKGKKKGDKGKGKDKKSSDKKSKSDKKDKGKKGKDKKKGGAEEKAPPKKEDFSCPPFDAHAQLEHPPSQVDDPEGISEDPTETAEEIMRRNLITHYKLNLYTIVYSELQNAVMDIGYMLDTFECPTATHQLIKKLDEDGYCPGVAGIRDIFDLKKAMDEGRLKDIVSKREDEIRRGMVVQREASENSIWTILDSREGKPKPTADDSRPISYPVDNYYELEENLSGWKVQTETEGGVVDENWQKGWGVGVQKDPPEGESPVDLEAYIEIATRETSVQILAGGEGDEVKGKEEKDEDAAASEDKFYFD